MAKQSIKDIVSKRGLPILTQSDIWKELSSKSKTPEMAQMEKKLSDLVYQEQVMKRQFSAIMDEKKKAMGRILALSEEAHINKNPYAVEKMKESEKLIKDINEKVEVLADRLRDIPFAIQEANVALLKESLKDFYKDIREGNKRKVDVDLEINQLRKKLNELRGEKDDIETKSKKIYSYLHDLLGPEHMEILDMEMGIE